MAATSAGPAGAGEAEAGAGEGEATAAPVSVLHAAPLLAKRDVSDVPYVELFGGRVQGVVSSSSDPNRVYVAYFESGTLNFNCSTNNNRPCGGLRGGPCKHLVGLLEEAVLQCGAERVARFLAVTGDATQVSGPRDILRQIRGSVVRADVSQVFSRFLSYLRYVELKGSHQPLPEMSWFVSG